MPAFLSPLFLFATLAAAIPVVLHLLKRDPEPRVKFAAVALLKHAPVERTSTRRLRQLVLLMLRVAGLVLLALAFARPFLPSAQAAVRGATLVALDTSFSLSAPGRFARARQLARDVIAQAPASDDVGVVTFADRADVVAPLSADRAAALAAVAAAAPGPGATRYLEPVNLAGRILAGRAVRNARLVVVTDLQENGWDAGDHASIPGSVRVEVRDVGALPDNFALAAIRSESDRAVVTVRNDSDRARGVAVRLTVDGRTAGERSLSLGPHASGEAVFPGVAGGEAVARIDDPEGLQADNIRYALLSDAAHATVLVVTASGSLDRDAFYVHQALGAGGGTRTPEVAGVAASQLGGRPAARLSDYAAVLLLSTRGLERRGRDALSAYLAGGGGLLIAAAPDVDGDVASEILGPGVRLRLVAPDDRERPDSQSLAPADVRHPVFQAFGPLAASLGLVRFSRAARVSGAGCERLARFNSGEAAVLDCSVGTGRALVVASDLNNRWNDFPLHATFVPFLHEAVRYLSNASPHAGEYLIAEVPAGVRPLPGIATVEEAGAARPRRVAINVDPAESEPARISAAEFGSAIARLKEAGALEARTAQDERESRQHLWQYLLAAMMVALAIEGLVANRTV